MSTIMAHTFSTDPRPVSLTKASDTSPPAARIKPEAARTSASLPFTPNAPRVAPAGKGVAVHPDKVISISSPPSQTSAALSTRPPHLLSASALFSPVLSVACRALSSIDFKCRGMSTEVDARRSLSLSYTFPSEIYYSYSLLLAYSLVNRSGSPQGFF